jgi:hypothetical protein
MTTGPSRKASSTTARLRKTRRCAKSKKRLAFVVVSIAISDWSSYRDARGRPKTVRYWTMTAIDGILAPAHEIDDARWLPLDVASATLSYPRDREVIARFKATHRS